MNSRLLFAAAAGWLLTAALPGAAAAPAKRAAAARGPAAAQKLPFATGRITYRVSGLMNGTSSLTWIESGRKLRQEMKFTTGQGTAGNTMQTWSITDGSYVYSSSPQQPKQVFRMKITPEMKKMGPQGLAMLPAATGKAVGKGTVAGKPCQIREYQGARVWLWHGLLLKMESGKGSSAAGGMAIEATRVETGVRVDPARFRVPPGMSVQDIALPGQPAPGSRPR